MWLKPQVGLVRDAFDILFVVSQAFLRQAFKTSHGLQANKFWQWGTNFIKGPGVLSWTSTTPQRFGSE